MRKHLLTQLFFNILWTAK